MVRLRKIHYQNLIVKSFSALLFNCKSRVKNRKMEQVAEAYLKHRMFDRMFKLWINEAQLLY